MKVFISWSGDRSKETAKFLSSWIRQVIQAAETWISSDIDKGIRWSDEVKNELEKSYVGIICLDKDNLQSEWILFEAGALSKTKDAHVCTFLLDINPADVKQPLGQFQHTLFNKEDVRKLMFTINNKISGVGEKSVPESDLNEIFELSYPKLEQRMNEIKNQKQPGKSVQRTERDILEEILQIVRRSKSEVIYDDNFLSFVNEYKKYSLVDLEKAIWDRTRKRVLLDQEVLAEARKVEARRKEETNSDTDNTK